MAARSKAIIDKGGQVVEVVGIDGQVSRAGLDAWVESNNLKLTTVHDPPGLEGQSRTVLIRREFSFIVDLRTMKILKVYDGDTTGLMEPPPVEMAMGDILGRL